MSCLINRNQNGLIVNVTTPTGEKSQLFEAIHSNPFMGDAETSLRIFSSAYSKALTKENVTKYSTGEPKIFYKTSNGKVFDNIEELIIADDLGTVMSGFQTANGFTPVVSFDTSVSEKSRFITDQIKSGNLSASRTLDADGVTRFEGKGEFRESKKATAYTALQDSYILETPMKLVDGKLEFKEDINLQVVDGEVITLEEIPQKAPNNIALLAKYAELSRPEQASSPTDKANTKLEKSMMNFLSSLGFSTTTLTAYRERYKTKYGKDPDIQAIADIANKVVAFADGEVNIENLSEEVAHIAIEAYEDQNSIASMIATAHLTPEYTQHAEYYRSKYAPFYEGVELEERVRKEVLGKILAKQFIERFNQQDTTEESKGIIAKLLELWNAFTSFIQNRLKPYHKKALADINNKIIDAIITQDNVFDENLLLDGFFYNAIPNQNKDLESTLKKTKREYEDLFNRILKEKTPNTAELERIVEGMETATAISAANTIIGIAQRQMNIMRAEVTRAVKNGSTISVKERNRFNTLNIKIAPMLELLAAQMRDLQNKAGQEKIIKLLSEQVDAFAADMGRMRPIMDANKEQRIREEVDALAEALDLDDKSRQELTSQIEGADTDLTLIGTKFQMASAASNLFVRLMHRKAVEIGSRVAKALNGVMNPVLDRIYNRGLQSEQKTIIERDASGKPTGWYIHMWDKAAMQRDEENERIRIMSELSGKSIEEITTALNNNKNNVEAIIGEENYYKLRSRMQEFMRKNTRNSRRNEKYYQERDRRFAQLNTSEYTSEYLSNINQSVFDIIKEAKNADGTLDKTKLTEAQRIAIEDHRKAKEVAKSAYDQFGQVRTGLQVRRVSDLSLDDFNRAEELLGVSSFVQDREGNQVNLLDPTMKGTIITLADGFTIDMLPDESRLALDLANTTLLYRQESRARGATRNEFFSAIEEIEARGENAFDWVTSNATISLSDEFYANLGENESFDIIAQQYIDTITDPAVKARKQAELSRLQQLQQIRKDLLRQNRRINNPIETDAKNMDAKVRQEVLDIDAELTDLYKLIDLPQEYYKEAGPRLSSRGVNDDFLKMAKEAGMSHYEFAQKHMTDANKRDVSTFGAHAQEVMKGVRTFLNPKYENFINRMYEEEIINDAMSPDDILSILKDEYAKSKVASYFQRFEPNGYADVMSALESGRIKMSDVLQNKDSLLNEYPGLQYLDITPDYSWTEDLNSLKYDNPEYYEGGYYIKPKMKYMNEQFFDLFGIDKTAFRNNPTDDITKLKATRNQKAFDLLVELTNLRKEANTAYGQIDQADVYKRVQMSFTNMESIAKSLGKVAGAKEAVKDFFQTRQDEQFYGEMLEGGESAKVIPRFFQKELEADTLTENILDAELINLKQALLYKERSEAEADMSNYLFAISKQKHKASIGARGISRTGETSNWYNFAQEYFDHTIYGIQQTRSFETQIMGKRVDFTKVINNLVSASQKINLAFSPLVAATSYTSGILNKFVNTVARDKYSKSANKFARKELLLLFSQHISETGKVNKKNSLTQLYEMFGVLGIEERTKNTKYGMAMRLLGDSAFALDQLANIPITGHSTLVVLKDTRFYNGKFRSFIEFKTKLQKEGAADAEILSIWESLYNDSLYDNITFTDGVQGPNQKFLDKGLTEKDFDQIRTTASARIKKLIQDVDGVMSTEDRVAAQRDIVTNVLVQHKGWLVINLHRGFRKRSLNIDTGVWEEGHYRTLGRFIQQVVKNRLNFKKTLGEFKGIEGEEFNAANLRRAGIESALIMAIFMFGLLLFSGDDDDDTYAENLAQLMFLRTYNEYNSTTLLGAPATVLAAIKDPMASLSYIQNFNPISLARNIGEEDADGNSKFWKQIGNTIPAVSIPTRRYNSLSDLENTIGLFKKNNVDTLWGFTGSKNEE